MLRAVEVMLTSSALTPAPGEAAFKSVGSHTSERDGLMIDLFSGNGPSGICLSYLLSGHKPYLDTSTVHPNPILYRKLQETKHLSITEQVQTPMNSLHMDMYNHSHDNTGVT